MVTERSLSYPTLIETFVKSYDARRTSKQKALLPESFDILILSAGGQFGAYGSGFLAGWSENSALIPRHKIDVITGVSTGAVMSTYAYLGCSQDPVVSKKYNDLLKAEYTTLQNEDLFRKRSWIELLWANSIYDSEPLRKRVESVITESLLDEVAAEAKQTNRVLLIGAVNVNSGDFEIFNLTEIAGDRNQDRRACYAAAVLASAAIPATFDAIFINGKMYIDGGIRKQGIFIEQGGQALPDVPVKRLFGILHGNLDIPQEDPSNNLLGVVSRTVSIVNDELLIDSAFFLDTKAKDSGLARSWAAPVRSGCESANPEGHQFSPSLGTCLWEKGYNDAKGTKPWKSLKELLQ
jgi:hypothetical protein